MDNKEFKMNKFQEHLYEEFQLSIEKHLDNLYINDKRRNFGKTTTILKLSSDLGVPVICFTNADYVNKTRAVEELGFENVELIKVDESNKSEIIEFTVGCHRDYLIDGVAPRYFKDLFLENERCFKHFYGFINVFEREWYND